MNEHLKTWICELMRIALGMIILTSLNNSFIFTSYAESFSNYSSFGGSTERSPNKKISKTCKVFTCGPTSMIKLSTVSPSQSTNMHNYSIGDNSTLEQMMKIGEDLNKFGPAGVMNQMGVAGQMGIPLDLMEKEKEIKIMIPMIDYGFSGTFNNILISVSENKNREYKSISQGLTNKDGQIEYTGSITIEKYTPFILKGSYSAPLRRYQPILWKDRRLVGQPDRFCPAFSDPSTPPCTSFTLEGTGNISGQFNIVSPWRDDDRLNKKIDVVSSYVNPLKSDIKGMLASKGIDIDVDKAFAKGGFGGNNSSRGSGSSGSTRSSSAKNIYGDCNCSCNFVQSSTTKCKTACSVAFSACNGERYKLPKTSVVSTNPLESLFPSLSPKVASPKVKGAKLLGIDQNFINSLQNNNVKIPKDLRKKYILLLKKKMPGENTAPIRKMMLMAFDEMPDDKGRMMMFKSAEKM